MANVYTQRFLSQFPGGPELVVECLNKSVAHTAKTCNEAMTLLMEMEKSSGFCCILLDIYRDTAHVDAQTCFLAIVLCKNVVIRCWQPRSDEPLLSVDEKAFIKKQLAHLIRTLPNLPYTRDLSLLLRRICRTDFPSQWPEIMECLLFNLHGLAIQESPIDKEMLTAQQTHSFFLIKQILKEQSSKRLPKDKACSYSIGQDLLEWMGPIWLKLFDVMRVQEPRLRDFRHWEASRYLDEASMYILIYFFERLHEVASAIEILRGMAKKLQLLARLAMTQNYYDEDVLFGKHLKSTLKNWTLLSEYHPFAFVYANPVEILPTAFELLKYGIQQCKWPVPLLSKCLDIINAGFRCHSYHQRLILEESSDANTSKDTLALSVEFHKQFSGFLDKMNGITVFAEHLVSLCVQIEASQIEEAIRQQDELGEMIGKRDLQKASKSLFEEIHQEPFTAAIIAHVMKLLEESIQSYTQSESTKQAVKGLTAIEWCSRCDALLNWAILILKSVTNADAMFSQLVQSAPHFVRPSAHPLLQYRVTTLLKKALHYGTIPIFEAPKVFYLLHQLLKSPHLFVRRAILYPLKLLYSKFHDDPLWLQGGAIEDIISDLVQLLFQLSQPDLCYACLDVIQCLLPCAPNELCAIQGLAQHQWEMRKLWDLGHSNIQEEVINVLNTLLVRYETPNGIKSSAYSRWVLQFSEEILSDFLKSSADLSVSANAADKQFFKKMLSLWISILRVFPLDLIDAAKMNQMKATFSSLLAFCITSLESISPDVGQRTVEVVIEYCALFVTIQFHLVQQELPLHSYSREVKGSHLLCDFFTEIIPLIKVGLWKHQSHWVVRRCLHLLLFLLYYGLSTLPAAIHTEYLESLLKQYVELSEIRQFGDKLSVYNSSELMKYTPEHFIPAICCWLLKFPLQFKETEEALFQTDGIQTKLRILLCLFNSFNKIQDTLLRTSLMLCELTILSTSPSQIALAKSALPTLLQQLNSILESLTNSNSLAHSLLATDSFFSAFQGSIHQGVKMPAASRFYFAFKLAIAHPEVSLSQDGLSCVKASTQLVINKFMNYISEVISVSSKFDADQLFSLLEAAPESVKASLSQKKS